MWRQAVIASIALLAGGASWVAAQPPTGTVDTSAQKPAIAIRGHVKGLYPGTSKRLRLWLHNRSQRDLVVTAIRARAGDPSHRCSGRNLKTRAKRLRRRVPGRSTRPVRYRIAMSADAADACQGARFPLRYRARVRR